MIENINVFDFSLNSNDMAKIAALDKGKSQSFDQQDPKKVQWIIELHRNADNRWK